MDSSSSSYSPNPHRPSYRSHRPFRPPDRYSRRPTHPPSTRVTHSVLLVRTAQTTFKPSTVSEIETLVQSCPNRPYDKVVHQKGRLAAILTYDARCDAVEAAAFFWKRRLAESHCLSVKLTPPAGVNSPEFKNEQRMISTVFLRYVEGVMESDPAVRRCKEKIDQVRMEIRKVTQLLSARNKFMVFAELQEKKQSLQTELDQVESRFREFKDAMDCITARLRYGKGGEVEEVEGKVRIFEFGEELDFDRIQALILRECRRLNDGLPVYGSRSKILNHIFANQVMILVGETGSGKSTQLVQYLSDSNLTKNGSIVCTQPRKIAAISLAERVSEESASCHSDTNSVLSYPTVSPQNNFKSSRVIFTTDHCFLQHCMGFKDNNGLNNASYIIVDEAHERSLSTDLLLALIKKKLLERMDLRLIIMSATCDASKLSSYFYGCETIRVSGRTFPVEINYVPNLQREINGFGNYVSDVLRMVEKVHKNESEGAILAFLTSQMEVEFACENFTGLTAVVLPMHGKLSPEEQSQVFKNYPGKRKIIFSTNIAETSLTIKGVKYVIDSGLVKESRFEPKNGMNILKVNWISQSSAEQRAGRAGRMTAGKCFRLYTEFEFREMDLHPEPEIRKVHLGTAVLRILSLGVKNVRNFEFVDAPSQQAIETAVKNLVLLGAIKISGNNEGHELTLTGQSLVKLGIEPRLGKIILDSFSCGLKKEGLVLASVMANSSSIFCRIGSAEEKSKADCLKVSFCHSEGDLFTLLTVYKKWEEERENNKNKWCWQNSINAKSMRRCNETVKELENCLKHETNTIIPSYWTWDPEKRTPHDKALKKIILSCLVENLAMFSGHERLGFQVALTGQNVHLHPSCSLYVSDRNPNWVVFGEILSVPNQYLVCVTAVDFDDLLSVEIESLPFDFKLLESCRLHVKRITGVSTSVLRRFCGRLCQNLHRFVSQMRNKSNDERINIEADFETGKIQIFALEKDLNEISLCLKEVLSLEEKWLKDECWEKALYPVRPGQPGQTALLGSGGLIKHLELEKRYLTVEIIHPNAETLIEKNLLSFIDENLNGGIVNVHKFIPNAGNNSDKWGRITFIHPDKAEEAVDFLTGLTFEGADLKVVPVLGFSGNFKREPFGAVRARLSWPRRPFKGIAILRCLKGEAPFIVRDLFSLSIGDRYVDCQVSTKYEDCIYATGISHEIPESEIQSLFRNSTSRRIVDIKLLRGPPAGDLLSESVCKDTLVRMIKEFMPDKYFPEKNFRVEVFKPEENEYFMKAVITFDGSLHLEAAKALEFLEGRVLAGCQNWQVIECQHVFQSTLTCPNRVFNVVKNQIEILLRQFHHQKGVSYNMERNENGLVRIKIIANATKTIADLRKPLEQLTKGKTLTLNHLNLPASIFHLILSRDGLFALNSVERETGTYILYDRQCFNIKIFGSAERIEIAERKLQDSLLQLQENKILEVKLKGNGLPRNLMKEIIKRFGPDLGLLKQIAVGSEINLNTKRHILFVRGNKEEKMKVEEAIADVAALISSDSSLSDQNTSESDSSCPICLCELEEAYKLDSCNHKFCRNCLIDQIETSIRSRDNFPLCCLKQNCKSPILLLDLKSLLSISRLDDLFRASLGYFVATNSLIYRFCPTPDCPSVYKLRGPGSRNEEPFICGACYTETCTKCSLEYHPFVSCEQYKEYKADPDLSLLEWRKGKKDVRNCPANCGFIIEKVDGCDHVKCKCEKHVCWGCMKYFETENQCYVHIHAGHGHNDNNNNNDDNDDLLFI